MILVTRRPPSENVTAEIDARSDVRLWPEDRVMPREVLLDQVRDATGLLCMLTDPVDRDLLEAAPDLRVVSTLSVGYDHVDVEACRERGITVGHTPDVLTDAVADWVLTLLLASARRLPEAIDHVRDRQWRSWGPTLLVGRDLHDARVGIVGLGRVGQAVARRLQGFDVDLLYHQRRRDAAAEQEHGARWVPLEELLVESDFVVLLAPLTPETHRMIGPDQLAAMRPTSYLLNAARGPLVDHEALHDALASGSIAGAALDVTDPEPIPDDSPLLDLANCLVVPHLGSASVTARARMAELAWANLLAGLAGEEMPAPVG